MRTAVARAARDHDVTNLAGDYLTSPDHIASSRPVVFEHVLRGGVRTQATVFKLSIARLLAHHLTTEPRPRSTARLWNTEGDRSVLVGVSEGGALQPSPQTARAIHHDEPLDGRGFCTGIDLSCILNLAEAGGGCSTFFYTLPDSCIRPAPLGGACAGGYRKPSRRCCAAFARRSTPRNHNT